MTDHITVRHYLEETDVAGRRLGRHVVHDPRSRDFPAEVATKIVDVEHQAFGLPLDQGSLGSCTANALVGALQSVPNVTPAREARPLVEKDAQGCYHVETALEGQPWPPNDPGGSGLMVCKAGEQLHWVRSYSHAFGLEHALKALVKRPCIFGVSWYDSFDSPDPQTGVVELPKGAHVRGGHEVVADAIKASDELVGFWNSWGTAYGLCGRFWMPFSVLERLLSEQGDCTVPIPA
jgi:hypothetical protein